MPVAPVRAHVMQLRAYGISWRRLSELSGSSISFVRALVEGYRTAERYGQLPDGVDAEVAARLRWIQPELRFAGPKDQIESAGSRRRLQALIAAGWSAPLLAEKLSTTRGYVRDMAVGTRRFLPDHVHRIERLHRALWDQPPPRSEQYEKLAYARALSMARRYDWVTTLAWDDIDRDEAPARLSDAGGEETNAPDETAVIELMAGRRVPAARADYLAAIDRLTARDVSQTEIGERIGWSQARVSKVLSRARDEARAN
ncbi:hypothetical protein ACXR2T_09965 [Leucobacter sp. HY1910]